MVTAESIVARYYAKLADRQEEQIQRLYAKAGRILWSFGIKEGNPERQEEEMVATMYLGETRYQIRQSTNRATEPIRILKGGVEKLGSHEPTDLEECGQPQEPTEMARLCSENGVICGTNIMGQAAKPHESYVWGLPQLEICLGLWDQVLAGSEK